ncbi:MAG: outer membrane beta-barrel family protein [Bacteroidota bacterium]|nr:outer membrane beta-barrel family protein [Bacteroidota bacterium]
MRKILLFIFIVPLFALAQDRGGGRGIGGSFKGFGKDNSKDYIKGNIVGKVLDSETGEPLEFANISLSNIRWNKIVEGTITDEKGKFYIEKIRSGKYRVNISFIGYNTQEIDFELTKRKPDVKLGEILMIADSEMLSEVKIIEQKPIYENKIDKIVYNAENDMNEGLSDATDVLRKAPLLTVDLEGEVSLRGSKNIKFLVNGKASTFFTSDIATALKMIPSDEIKSVEIITSPGAKYDGEGDAGIVNIVTKKKIIDGYKSTINTAFGTKVNRQSANLSIGKGRFGLSARGGIHYNWARKGFSFSKREDWDENNINDIKSIIDTSNTFSQYTRYNGSINMFYDINGYNNIMSDIRIGGRRSYSYDSTSYYFVNDSREDYESYIKTNSSVNRLEWSTDYTKTFEDAEEKELSISFQIGGNFGDDDIDNLEDGNLKYHNANDEKEMESTLQLDYIHPFWEENKIELGGKLINRNREMVYSNTSSLSEYSAPQETFNYSQKVFATYLSSDWVFPSDIGVKAGLRHEYTQISGDWQSGEDEPFKNDYGKILPSLAVAKKFSDSKSLKISYNKRISRPRTKYINPNTLNTNNFSRTIGNPDLSPSLTHQVEMGYNSFGKKYQGSYYVYAKQTKDIVESYSRMEDGLMITTFENIGSSITYGINYYGSLRYEKWNIRAGFNLYQYKGSATIDGNEESLTSNLLYSYNFGGMYDLGKKWKVEGWGFFRSPSQTIQGTATSFSMMSFGVKKELNNKRGSVGIHIVEPFSKYKIFSSDTNADDFTYTSDRYIAFRSIGINFQYTFGKLNFKSASKKSNINNDDVDQGDGQEF